MPFGLKVAPSLFQKAMTKIFSLILHHALVENFHQNSEPIQTTEATFDRRPNGQVKQSFQTPDTKPISDSPQLSYTAMITAVQTGQEKKLPIHGFSSEGYLVYSDKINGHFI